MSNPNISTKGGFTFKSQEYWTKNCQARNLLGQNFSTRSSLLISKVCEFIWIYPNFMCWGSKSFFFTLVLHIGFKIEKVITTTFLQMAHEIAQFFKFLTLILDKPWQTFSSQFGFGFFEEAKPPLPFHPHVRYYLFETKRISPNEYDTKFMASLV